MADTEFDDFMDTEDDFEDSDDEDGKIIDITDHLKWTLHITTVPPSYNVPNNLYDMLNSTDLSSDDEQGITMQVMSDSDDDEVKINPYWSKIVIDELQNPMTVNETDMDLMPDLEAVSDSGTSEDSIQFIYTPSPSPCLIHKTSAGHKMSRCMK